MARHLTFLFLLTMLSACAQTDPTEMNAENPLLCDPETGTCEVPTASAQQAVHDAPVVGTAGNTITIQYFTDPICSSCWGIEPQLRRLAVEYGAAVDLQYHMGGLLPGWDGFNGGGISKPSDVATHWDEMSLHYKMPIIGDVWLEDPLASSYPPSIAFKAAELQDKQRAHALMRRMREMVFLEKRNIARQEVINEAAAQVGLDPMRLESDMKGAGDALFRADLALARASGVRGFPTMILSNAEGQRQVVYGARSYEQMVQALKLLAPELKAAALPTTVDALFALHPSWCAQEAALMLATSPVAVTAQLNGQVKEGKLLRTDTRNGSIWRKARL
jgi:predicted DsbA family dithiol-disulfide isomerase